MRPEVDAFAQLGPLPSESEASAESIRLLENGYRAISRPVSDEEASALVTMFRKRWLLWVGRFSYASHRDGTRLAA
jgi:hypothetical protein